jgi:hypothetical protein
MAYYRPAVGVPHHQYLVEMPPHDSRPMNTMSQHMIQQQQYAMMRGMPYPQPIHANTATTPNQPSPMERILSAMDDHHKEQLAQSKKLEETVKALIATSQDETKACLKRVTEHLEDSTKKHLKSVVKRVERLENAIGVVPQGKSIVDTLSSVGFGVEELLERAKDSEAPSRSPFNSSMFLILSPASTGNG